MSIPTIVSDFVREFIDLTRTSQNEEELRNSFCVAAVKILEIRDLKLERDREDVRRNKVIIEFKDKGLFNGSNSSAKFIEAKNQLINNYIPGQALRDGRTPSEYIGICFDGIHLAYVFLEPDGHARVTDLLKFNEISAETLVNTLLLDNRIELTAANITDDFGPNSLIAQNTIMGLWTDLNNSLANNITRVEMLFKEWSYLFEQTTSMGEVAQVELKQFLLTLGLPGTVDTTRLLFVLHTYHALVFKLLAAEVVLANTEMAGMPSDFCLRASALDNPSLSNVLSEQIEDSKLFRHVNILNFIEGSFFSWYLVNPSPDLIDSIRRMLERIGLYGLNGIKLERTRDIVKRVYESLVPDTLRHNIGEYFTPEWLVEFTLNRLGYEGAQILNKKILDPCCGSGNFIIHAIDRYKKEALKENWQPSRILSGILEHIFGFDLNPLAVLTARVNYLMAISDLISTLSDVEIPIYQADAVFSPTISSNSSNSEIYRQYPIQTHKRDVTVTLPENLIKDNLLFARILEIMEGKIKLGVSVEEFVSAINKEPDYFNASQRTIWEECLCEMFHIVDQLEKEDWNRIWCRIIRNYFASVAVGKCDYICGNPPWVRWSELPERYTNRIKDTCISYGIFSKDRFFGGNELDISGMITYTVADKWLKNDGGMMSFIITQTHFQSQSSGGFRNFNVKGVPIKVYLVDDFIRVQPWRSLGNKPSIINIEKGKKTTYPIPYIIWDRKNRNFIPDDFNWEQVESLLTDEILEANQLNGSGHRWSIMKPGRFSDFKILDGADNDIIGRKGIVTDLNGAYFIDLLGQGRISKTVRFSNCPNESRNFVPPYTGDIESELIYPLLKGAADIKPFCATVGTKCVIVPNRNISATGSLLLSEFAKAYPLALQYFRTLNITGIIERRSTWSSRQLPQFQSHMIGSNLELTEIPFYSIYDIGDYTFSKYKVVWPEMAGSIRAAVVSDSVLPWTSESKSIVPDHKIYFASFTDKEKAHYVCALLNSLPVAEFIDSFTIKIQVGTLFKHIRFPLFDSSNKDHIRLAILSEGIHDYLLNNPVDPFPVALKNEIDDISFRILGINQ